MDQTRYRGTRAVDACPRIDSTLPKLSTVRTLLILGFFTEFIGFPSRWNKLISDNKILSSCKSIFEDSVSNP